VIAHSYQQRHPHRPRRWACAIAFLVFAQVATTSFAAGQSTVDAERLFDSFTVSLVAASRCDPPDERTMTRFLGNLLIVQDEIRRQYRARYPNADETTLLGIIDNRIKRLGNSLENRIAARGCMDESIIKLVRLFELNARPDLFTKRAK
jgi:hypothetical protein